MGQEQSEEKMNRAQVEAQIKSKFMDPQNITVAFAMGGLAGNNAHGAGFLQAAIDKDIKPIMISCTSGQLLWVKRYLEAANSKGKLNLKDMLGEDIRKINPKGDINMALMKMAFTGKPGIFAPGFVECMLDTRDNFWDVWHHVCKKYDKVLLMQEWLELFPCRPLVPDFPETFFEEIVKTFHSPSILQENGAEPLPVGIVFNSYNPKVGEEYVYLNEEARKLLNKKSQNGKQKYATNQKNEYRDRTTYRDIDPEAVRKALWLYQYGFDRKKEAFVDGTYFRGIILSELSKADRIFCVRPINHEWKGHLPRNYPELEDLKAEIGFDGAYCGERYQIELINKLILDQNLAYDGKYHFIDLQEIEIKQPRGYFDYLFESEHVYEDAHEDAINRFEKLGY